MNLTVEQLMAQIIKFLETGQPNMAALYMKKALELLKKEKAQSDLAKAFAPLAEARSVLATAARETFAVIAAAVAPIVDMFSEYAKAFQSDFALAADL